MAKISSCPICKTPIEQDYEQCPTCNWTLNIDGLLEIKRYNLLIEWALFYYQEAKILRSKYECSKQYLTHRIDTHRSDIDANTNDIRVLKEQVNRLIKYLPASSCNSQDSSGSVDYTPAKSTNDETDNNGSSAPLREMFGNNASEIEYSTSALLHTDTRQDDDFECSENSQLTQIHQRIISEYYHNPSDFARNYDPKIATITKETINSIWRSEQKVVILTEADNGNYWIFERESICYLVPFHPLSYVNKNSYKIFNMIFDCHNYTPDYQSMQLVEAAIVTNEGATSTSPKTWRLQQQGKLVFR